MQAELSYEYMRGTTDEGNYLHPSKVQINKRKLGSLAVRERDNLIALHCIASDLHAFLSA